MKRYETRWNEEEFDKVRQERDEARRERDRLRTELENIAAANYHEWDDGFNNPQAFVDWAQSRARAALADRKCAEPTVIMDRPGTPNYDEMKAKLAEERQYRETFCDVYADTLKELHALRQERNRLRVVLAESTMPLQVIAAQIRVKRYKEFTDSFQNAVLKAAEMADAALTPQEPHKEGTI